MKQSRELIASLVTLILAMALVRSIDAQNYGTMQTFFSKDYVGISLKAYATNETVPNDNVTLRLWANYTSDWIHVEYFNLSIQGFRMGGPEKIILQTASFLSNVSVTFNQTDEREYMVLVPADVYGQLYCELSLKYTVVDEPFSQNPIFAITYVRNVFFENLKAEFQRLNETHQQLNASYWQLNDEYGQLNETYWGLYQNYTSLEGTVGELDNTRRLAVILGVTTVSFVATTLYLVMRKPREAW